MSEQGLMNLPAATLTTRAVLIAATAGQDPKTLDMMDLADLPAPCGADAEDVTWLRPNAEEHRKLSADLVDAVMSGQSVSVISGQRGAGKTALLEEVTAALLRRNVRVLRVGSQGGEPINLRSMMDQVIGGDPDHRAAPGEQFYLAVTRPKAGESRLALLIDDAHLLTAKAWSYLDLLNSTACVVPLRAQFILAGSDSVWRRMPVEGSLRRAAIAVPVPGRADAAGIGDARNEADTAGRRWAVHHPVTGDASSAEAGGTRRRWWPTAAMLVLILAGIGVPWQLWQTERSGSVQPAAAVGTPLHSSPSAPPFIAAKAVADLAPSVAQAPLVPTRRVEPPTASDSAALPVKTAQAASDDVKPADAPATPSAPPMRDEATEPPPPRGESAGSPLVAPHPEADRTPPAPPPPPIVQPEAAPPAQTTLLAPASRPAPVRPAPVPPAADSAVTLGLLARGDALLAAGDVTAARLLYERATADNSARAFVSLGRTYDPRFLAHLGAQGLLPNPERAAAAYQRGAALGSAEAVQALIQLKDIDSAGIGQQQPR